ncbi:MAG TPA: hypothetical protein PLN38_16940 [Chitinophagales bacterium]|nr:hypothetical protein [Chitinophagales bacterium]
MAKLRAIINGNRIVALGEHADDISVPVPYEITFNNFDRMELVGKDSDNINYWQYIHRNKHDKEQEAVQILEKAYAEIAIVTEKTIDEAHDFVKGDLVGKGKVEDTKKQVDAKLKK